LKEAIPLNRHIQLPASLLELPLGKYFGGRNDTRSIPNLDPRGENIPIPDVCARSSWLLVQQILKFNLGPLESIRISIREIVRDVIEVQLLPFHARGASV
jgi:hypothetical protein